MFTTLGVSTAVPKNTPSFEEPVVSVSVSPVGKTGVYQ